MTILVVEDSRFACEAVRLLCLRSGARIRRADCLRSARRHLSVYQPTVAIVDMGLPDGSGAELISDLAQGFPRVPVLLGTSGDSFAEDLAIAAGADGFLAKPVSSVSAFQNTVLNLLPPDLSPGLARLFPESQVTPDPLTLHEDYEHVADLLSAPAGQADLSYVLQFLGGLAQAAQDNDLVSTVDRLRDHLASNRKTQTQAQTLLLSLVQDRLEGAVVI
jgi:DNA-binding NarL/FixJ family response regulator